MERIPIFSVHSINFNNDQELLILHGRALDNLRSGNKLYVSDSDFDFNFRIVEVIENENKTVSVLDIMELGAVTFKVEGQQFNIGNYLYGESVDEYIPRYYV